MPIRGDGSLEDLIDIADQYRESPQSTEVLELSLKNLAGNLPGSEAFTAKWCMINDNQVWAKRTFLLLTELHAENQEQFESFRGF